MSRKIKHFKHSVLKHSDLKIQSMMNDYGFAGYGMYWYINEKIAMDDNNRIELDDLFYSFLTSKFGRITALPVPTNEQNSTNSFLCYDLLPFVKMAVNEFCGKFKLFTLQDNFISASDIDKDLEKSIKTSLARSEAGKQSARNKLLREQNLFINLDSKSSENPTNEQNEIFADLSILSNSNLMYKKRDAREKHLFSASPYFDIAHLKSEIEKTDYGIYDIDYYYAAVKNWSGDNLRKNWRTTLIQFILNDMRDHKALLKNTSYVTAAGAKGNMPNYWSEKFAKYLTGAELSNYFRHLVSLGLESKKDARGNIIDFIKKQ